MAEIPGKNPSSKKNVINLNAIVERWAWQMFDTGRTGKQKKLKLAQLDFDINWKKVEFIHSDPDYTKPDQNDKPAPKHKAQVLFKTQFVNRTDQEQEYSFKTERTTKSTCTVEVENGLSLGFEASICLKTPLEVLEANAGFSREVEVVTTDSQTTEEEMVWGVDSQIKVKAKTMTVAKLVVDEHCEKDHYRIISHMFGPVNVNITNREKEGKHVTCVGGRIERIIEECARPNERNLLKVDKTKKLYPHSIVTYESTGRCTFKFGVEQRVDLSEEPIE